MENVARPIEEKGKADESRRAGRVERLELNGRVGGVISRKTDWHWFSIEPMMGITWWNVVDDCGAPGEPSISGLFTRDMQPKPSFHALNELINDQWKTRTTVKAGKDGTVAFRGFRGQYRLAWTDADGNARQTEVHLGGNP